jgi:metal-responsive CopG/Arc/MetJ family transcriptional regulator
MAIRSTRPGARTGSKTRRTTIALPIDLLEAADREVQEGRAASRAELMADALSEELRRREREAIDRDIRGMAADAELLAEHRRLMREFDADDRETWAAIPE